MKVAIPTNNGKVAKHFGRAPEYTVFTVQEKEITDKKIIDNPGHKPGYLPKFLNKKNIDCMVTSGIGKRAIQLFNKFNINVISGAEGEIDKVIQRYIEDKLEGSKNPCDPGEGKNKDKG
ncbi:MAG: NifB/NifX family molybdenum-iron cluster-binding protein [archaeon]